MRLRTHQAINIIDKFTEAGAALHGVRMREGLAQRNWLKKLALAKLIFLRWSLENV